MFKIMNLQHIRIEKEISSKSQPWGIRFIKNQKCFMLYSLDHIEIEEWVKHLTNHCILSNFNKKYRNVKAIGKGTFAKVYLVQREGDHQEFAVKTFEKRFLEEKGAEKNKVAFIFWVKYLLFLK
jgi:serine/threonine protein kinase